jgi:hypothetical protein
MASRTNHCWSTEEARGFNASVSHPIEQESAHIDRAFAGSTDVSFRNAAGHATFRLASALIDIGIRANLIHHSSENAVRKRMIQFPDQQLESNFTQFEEIRFALYLLTPANFR